MPYLQQLLILCPLIFLAGFIDSIAGGGGLISLTAYYMVGLPSHEALGTNKLSSLLGTITSTARFFINKSYYRKSLISSIIFALLGSVLGAKLALLVDEKILRIILVVSVPFIAGFILMKKDFDDPVTKKEMSDFKIILLCSIISFVVGIYDGFFGPGAGTFLIIAHLAIVNLSLRESMGNAKFINLATNIAAFAVYLINGKIVFALALPAAIFSVLGNYIGSGLALKIGKNIVRPVMVIVLVLLIVKLLTDMM